MRTSPISCFFLCVWLVSACDVGVITTGPDPDPEPGPDASADVGDESDGGDIGGPEPETCTGDGVCDSGEDCENCPLDCGQCVRCGDDVCSSPIETMESCPADCVACGDGACGPGEDRYNCALDCEKCGDYVCGPSESRTTCSTDCVICGDTHCDSPETRASCPDDCETCGDGVCGIGESSANCCQDCGCSGGYVCDGGTCGPPCSSEAFHLYNWMPDIWMYSVACGTSLLQVSMMLVCDSTDCSSWVGYGGHTTYTVPYDQVRSLHAACCYSDGTTCFTPTHTCTTDSGSYPCRCVEGDIVVVADTCPSEVVVVCE